MSYWKAVELAGVKGFRIKEKLSRCQKLIVAEQFKALTDATEEILSWLIKRRTSLYLKAVSEGNAAGNYRPISSLPLIWKLLSGRNAEEMYKNLEIMTFYQWRKMVVG